MPLAPGVVPVPQGSLFLEPAFSVAAITSLVGSNHSQADPVQVQLLEADFQEQAQGFLAQALGERSNVSNHYPHLGILSPQIQIFIADMPQILVVLPAADGEFSIGGVHVIDLRLDEGPSLLQRFGPNIGTRPPYDLIQRAPLVERLDITQQVFPQIHSVSYDVGHDPPPFSVEFLLEAH